MHTIALLALLLLASTAHSALVCPRFTDIDLAQQPILAGSDCSDNKPLPGACDESGFGEGLSCITVNLFMVNATTESTPMPLICAATECDGATAGTLCACTGVKLCVRTVASVSVPFACSDDGLPPATTTTTTTTTAPPPNYCDEDDELGTDCSKPADDTVVFLVVFFGALILLIACAACVGSWRTRRDARLD